MGLLSKIKRKHHSLAADPHHVARKSLRHGLDIVVDLDGKRIFLEGLGGQHELEQLSYDGTFLSCKLNGKVLGTQTASVNISQWKASILPSQIYCTPNQLATKLGTLFRAKKTKEAFADFLKRQDFFTLRAAILGTENTQSVPATYEQYVVALEKELAQGKQNLAWLVGAAKAIQSKRYQ